MIIQIVDSQDKLITLKDRRNVDHDSDIYRVSGLWVINSMGQALIAQRAAVKNNEGGKWGPSAAGTLEEGETYESNVRKEAEEEIGLTGVEFVKLDKVRVNGKRSYFAQWFKVHVDMEADDFRLQDDEVDAVKWVDVDNLKLNVIENPGDFISSMSKSISILDGVIKQ